MRKSLYLLYILFISQLGGCGIISIGYNYAEAYLRYSINSYTTFNDTQKEIIKHDVNVFMTAHRKYLLPEYVTFLQELQKTVQSGAVLTKEEVARYRSEVRGLYVKTLFPALKPSAHLLSGLDASQIQELEKTFATENKKKKDKELSGTLDEQLRKRAARTIEFIKNLVGGLKDDQREAVRDMNRQLPYATPLYIAQREDNQARLIELLNNNQDEEEIEVVLRSWLISPGASRSPDERRIMLAFESTTDEMIANIYQLLNERQKKELLKNILKYIESFQQLAAQT